MAVDLGGDSGRRRHRGEFVDTRGDRRHHRRARDPRCHLASASVADGNGHGNILDELRQLRRTTRLQDGSALTSMSQLWTPPIVGSLTPDAPARIKDLRILIPINTEQLKLCLAPSTLM
jgi:hypothetical protein